MTRAFLLFSLRGAPPPGTPGATFIGAAPGGQEPLRDAPGRPILRYAAHAAQESPETWLHAVFVVFAANHEILGLPSHRLV